MDNSVSDPSEEELKAILDKLQISSERISQMARAIRLIAVRGYLRAGQITKEDALEVLHGRLSPDDPSSVVDDSRLLDMTLAEVAKELGLEDKVK